VLLAGHGSTLDAATVATEPMNVRAKRDETNERRWVEDMRNRIERAGIVTLNLFLASVCVIKRADPTYQLTARS
jgi:hypothetical protein